MRASRSSTPRASRGCTSPGMSLRSTWSGCSSSARTRRSSPAVTDAASSKWCDKPPHEIARAAQNERPPSDKMHDFVGTPVRAEESSDPRRTLLLELLQTGLARVHGRHCVATALAGKALPAPVWVAAIGKAATAMALGAHQALGHAIERTLIITREREDLGGFPAGATPEVWVGSHPLTSGRALARLGG